MPDDNGLEEYNPYDYIDAITDDYDSDQATRDLYGRNLDEDFLNETDPSTGLTYRDLILQYDPTGEQELYSTFKSGAKSALSSTIGSMANVRSQERIRSAGTGFAGAGAGSQMLEETSQDTSSLYGDAFSGALMDLTRGVTRQRETYQEDLARQLDEFAQSQDIFDYDSPDTMPEGETDAEGDPIYGGGTSLDGYPDINFPEDGTPGEEFTHQGTGDTYIWNENGYWQFGYAGANQDQSVSSFPTYNSDNPPPFNETQILYEGETYTWDGTQGVYVDNNGNPWSGYGDIGQGTGETGSYQGNVTEGGEVGSDATGQQQYQNFPTGQMTNVGEPFDPYTNIGTVIVVESEPPRTFMWDNENNVYVEYAEGGGQLGQTAPNQ